MWGDRSGVSRRRRRRPRGGRVASAHFNYFYEDLRNRQFLLLLFTVLGEHGSPSACYLQYLVSVRFISVVIYSTW